MITDLISIVIPLVVLLFLMYLFKYKNNKKFFITIGVQLFLIIFLTVILIFNIVNFEKTTSFMIKLILISSVIVFGVLRLIKKLNSK